MTCLLFLSCVVVGFGLNQWFSRYWRRRASRRTEVDGPLPADVSDLLRAVDQFARELRRTGEATLQVDVDLGSVCIGAKRGVVLVAVDQMICGVFGDRPVDGPVVHYVVHRNDETRIDVPVTNARWPRGAAGEVD